MAAALWDAPLCLPRENDPTLSHFKLKKEQKIVLKHTLSRRALRPSRSLRLTSTLVRLQRRCVGLALLPTLSRIAAGTEAPGRKPWVEPTCRCFKALCSSASKLVLLVNFPTEAEIHAGACPNLTGIRVIAKGSRRHRFGL